ncbi:MAG: hypothetical protein R2774_01860 [Saprospiraceae bacterium]
MFKFHILILISFSLFLGCSEEAPILFQDEELFVDFTIPAGLNTVETHTFTLQNVKTNFLKQCQIHGVDPENIREVFSIYGSFEGKFAAIDYSALSRVQIFARSVKDGTLKAEMYYHEMIGLNNITQLKLLSSGTNLYDIFKDDDIVLEIKLNFKSFLVTNSVTRFKFGYAVR